MANKRNFSNPKSSNFELLSALKTYKDINSTHSLPCPFINEFKSLSDALSAYMALSKILSSRLKEKSVSPDSLEKAKNQLKEEALQNQSSKLEKLRSENEYLNKQIPILMGKIESFRSQSIGTDSNSELIANQQVKIEELEQELLKNKEKIRMNSQLTQALSESVKREQLLKEKCDELLDNLNSALTEGENLAKKLSVHSPKKNSELAKMIENDLEAGGEKWKQLKYSRIEGLSDKENFELLRKIVDFRDSNREMRMSDLDDFEARRASAVIIERENDIKDLLKDYERLQTNYRDLEKICKNKEDENIEIREKLAEKTGQLASVFDCNQPESEELKAAKENYLKVLTENQELTCRLNVIRAGGKDFSLLLKEIMIGNTTSEEFANKAQEVFCFKLSEAIAELDSSLLEELKKMIKILNHEKSKIIALKNSSEVQLEAAKGIIEEIKKTEAQAKFNKNDWKRFRREHIQRLEKIYESQVNGLKDQILALASSDKNKDLLKTNEKLQSDLRDITLALKKEHESKKLIAELFGKEKEVSEKTRELLEKLKGEYESLQERYVGTRAAAEESNSKIFKLEQSILKTSELESTASGKEQILLRQIEDNEAQKTKLYSEVTKLNKKIQELEIEKKKTEAESKSSLFLTQENRESFFAEIQAREEKISCLEKENFKIKNEIFELDVKLKSSEMDKEKMQSLKKTINELQKQALSIEMINREKEYLNEENLTLREELKNSQSTIQQLKVEIRNISTELIEIQSELAKNQSFSNSSIKELQEDHSALLVQNEAVKKEIDFLRSELARVQEENGYFKNLKKTVETENISLKAKFQSSQKDVSAEFLAVKDKIKELESRYEKLESSQDEMIISIRKLYKNWCAEKKVPPLKQVNLDPTKEAVQISEHIISESKKPENSKKDSEKIQYLLGKIETQPDSIFKAQTLKLLSENLELKNEILERHCKAVQDETIFEELKTIQGINEWILQKWKDSEKDVTRLRKQLLDITYELENLIKSFRQPEQNFSFFQEKVILLEEQVLSLSNEKSEIQLELIKSNSERQSFHSTLVDLYQKLSGKYPDQDLTTVFPFLAHLENLKPASSLNKELTRLEELEKSLIQKEKLIDQRLTEKTQQENSGLVSALYEEKQMREELEEELNEKCNLIESILKEYEENKKHLKLREYEYQELLTLKDEEILKLKRELSAKF